MFRFHLCHLRNRSTFKRSRAPSMLSRWHHKMVLLHANFWESSMSTHGITVLDHACTLGTTREGQAGSSGRHPRSQIPLSGGPTLIIVSVGSLTPTLPTRSLKRKIVKQCNLIINAASWLLVVFLVAACTLLIAKCSEWLAFFFLMLQLWNLVCLDDKW